MITDKAKMIFKNVKYPITYIEHYVGLNGSLFECVPINI